MHDSPTDVTRREVEPGYAHRLGATFDGDGTNFALFSAHADRIELCLFDSEGRDEIQRVELGERTGDIWHGYLPGIEPGAVYGYRVYGPYEPAAGLRFNPHKLMLDPYAREMIGEYRLDDSHFAFDRKSLSGDQGFDKRDNAAFIPKAVVTPAPQIRYASNPMRVPWQKTVIYELHARGFTMLHPDIDDSERGSFAGLGRMIDYIQSLGVTSIELLPVHAFVDEPFLHDKGLSNYWGYNTLNFFCPHQAYLGGARPTVFREFVDRAHDAGLEVLLDVVYNHTAEGNHLGPTLCFRGIDNSSYYQLLPGDKRFYINDTGCGNTLNVRHPRVMQLVLDSLRYWAGEMGVDGFRFDLASVLGRGARGFEREAPFFQALSQDPILAGRKMIAEPWDIGPDGYQLGNYPAEFGEWNDRYRDTVRSYWRGDFGQLPEFARRLHGSSDIFEHRGRKPHASINFITSHDGFSLRDLVSYEHRNNQANQEDNNDGHRENLSCNYGVEGETDDAEINRLRWRQQRNFIATLLVSQGVPMLQAGDELGRTQGGNNNAYCQDNNISWIDWPGIDDEAAALIEFTRRMLKIRNENPLLQADRFRHQAGDSGEDSIRWLNSDGKLMRDLHWHERDSLPLGYLLCGAGTAGVKARTGLLVIFNASTQSHGFTLPENTPGFWRLLLDTADDGDQDQRIESGSKSEMAPRSMQIFFAAPESNGD